MIFKVVSGTALKGTQFSVSALLLPIPAVSTLYSIICRPFAVHHGSRERHGGAYQ